MADKKTQITLTTSAKVKNRDEIYAHRMGMTMSGVLNTLLYKLYYDGGKLPYQLNGGVKGPKADTDQDIIHRVSKLEHGHKGEKHHLRHV